MITIQNRQLTVDIDPLGAQLSSIRTPDGVQHLWQGDPEIWARRAPLLFPIVGRLQDSSYQLDGACYTIPTHGFARDSLFQVTQHSESSVSFQLTDTEQTRAVYPFAFALTVTYTLEDNRIVKAHRVDNRSDRTMLYELGGHDGFCAAAAPGETMADWAILLPGLEQVRFYGMDEALMVTPLEPPVPLDHRGGLPLTPSSYRRDTMIFDTPPQGRAVLIDGQGRPRVTLDCPAFPYLGIWTQAKPFDTHYVCIEPWTTLPDATFAGRGLADKPGIRSLAPGQTETLVYTTTIHGVNP